MRQRELTCHQNHLLTRRKRLLSFAFDRLQVVPAVCRHSRCAPMSSLSASAMRTSCATDARVPARPIHSRSRMAGVRKPICDLFVCGALPRTSTRAEAEPENTLVATSRRELLVAGSSVALLGMQAIFDRQEALAATSETPVVEFNDFDDDECGFTLKIPKGWEMETPGMRNEFHAPKDYGGKRIIVKREFLGKSKELDLHVLGDVDTYAKKVAYIEGEGAQTGTNAEVLSATASEDGRYFFIEYRINSFQSQRIWMICGAGLGSSPGARKFKNRQLITISGKMSEDELKSDPAGGELLKEIIASFRFTDKPFPEGY